MSRAEHVELSILEPANGFGLQFTRVPFDSESATSRIRILNLGVGLGGNFGFEDDSVSGPFEIVAGGGGLATDQEQFWDIVCKPTSPDGSQNTGEFRLDVCVGGCSDIEVTHTIQLQCVPGLLTTPEPTVNVSAYAYSSGRASVPFFNPGPEPVTITGFVAHDAAISGALEQGTLPLIVAAGETAAVTVTVDWTTAGVRSYLDVVAGTVIAGRIDLIGATRGEIQPAWTSVGLVPQGAVSTLPITVRNSFPSARTITAITSDVADLTATGLVGATLGPGELARGLVRLTASSLGRLDGALTVAFDGTPEDHSSLSATVVPPTFSLTTADGTPSDGRLDFGTRKVGSPAVERTFTITNLASVAQPVARCTGIEPPFTLVGACPSTLPAGASIELTIRFTPTAVGDFVASAGDFAVSVGLVLGDGEVGVLASARVTPAQLAFSATELGFPSTLRGEIAQQVVAITNLAAAPITLPVTVTGASFAVDASQLTIAAGATVAVAVAFHPVAAGVFTGVLELGAGDDPDHASLALSGVGGSPSVAVAETLELGTVTVGAANVASLAIHNLDPVHRVTIDQLVVEGAGFVAVMPANPEVLPGETTLITVRFSPAVPGPATGTLAVVLHGDLVPQAIVHLTGNGERPEANPPDHDSACSAGGSSGGWLVLALLGLAVARRAPRTARMAHRA